MISKFCSGELLTLAFITTCYKSILIRKFGRQKYFDNSQLAVDGEMVSHVYDSVRWRVPVREDTFAEPSA